MRLALTSLVCGSAILAVFAQDSITRASTRRPHYTDIASRSRIEYVSRNGFTGRKYFPQPMCGGVAILDFDGDGLLDIFFTNGAEFPSLKKTDASFYNRLYRNKGDG